MADYKGLFDSLVSHQDSIGEIFQDYFCSQDFEAGFPQKVSLKMLN